MKNIFSHVLLKFCPKFGLQTEIKNRFSPKQPVNDYEVKKFFLCVWITTRCWWWWANDGLVRHWQHYWSQCGELFRFTLRHFTLTRAYTNTHCSFTRLSTCSSILQSLKVWCCDWITHHLNYCRWQFRILTILFTCEIIIFSSIFFFCSNLLAVPCLTLIYCALLCLQPNF